MTNQTSSFLTRIREPIDSMEEYEQTNNNNPTCFSVTASADMSSDESLFLFCSETNNSEYQHLVFLIAKNGWLYDAVTTKEARFKAYGLTPYSFQNFIAFTNRELVFGGKLDSSGRN